MGYVTNLIVTSFLVLTPLVTQNIQEVPVTAPTAPYSTTDEAITYFARKYRQDEKLARKIISCEGQAYKQIGNNENYRNGVVWSTDIGWWQINDFYHEAPAKKIGLDIHNEYDNIEYGFILLSTQGVKPWSASKSCWST